MCCSGTCGCKSNLQRQLANFCDRYYSSPNVSTCSNSNDSQCAIRVCNSVYFNQFSKRYREANMDYFTRPCDSFKPKCKCN